MEIDIRNSPTGTIDTIRFSGNTDYRVATKLVQHIRGHFYIEDENDDNSVCLNNREQVEDLIVALQKAIELDWV